MKKERGTQTIKMKFTEEDIREMKVGGLMEMLDSLKYEDWDTTTYKNFGIIKVVVNKINELVKQAK